MDYITEIGIDTILIVLLIVALLVQTKLIDREHISDVMSTYPFSPHVDPILRKHVNMMPTLVLTMMYMSAINVSILGSINNDIYTDVAIISLLIVLTWWRYYNIWRAAVRKKGNFSNAIIKDSISQGIITFFTYFCIFYHLSNHVIRMIVGK